MIRVSPDGRIAIRREAKKLQRSLFERKGELWAIPPSDPLELIDPQVIITKLLGLRYSEPEEIPPHPDHPRIAGFMDREKREIVVAQRQKSEVRRFTAAHEIGHWILHPGQTYFRDLPLDGSDRDQDRPPEEREANLFAADLLMPETLIRKKFRAHFGTDSLANMEVNEDLIALLTFGTDKQGARLSQFKTTRDLSKLAAQCLSLRNHGALSLANQFKVSQGAMAIRLEEFDLIPFLYEEVASYDTFISYRKEDQPFAEKLVKGLQENGLNPWYDGFLRLGGLWQRQIGDAAKGSRSAIIILNSSGLEGYQEVEVTALVGEMLKKNCPIIPIFVKGLAEESVPFFLRGFQWVDFHEDKEGELEKVIQSILRVISR